MGLQLEIQNTQVHLSRGWNTLFIIHYPQKFQVKFSYGKILPRQKNILSWEDKFKNSDSQIMFLSAKANSIFLHHIFQTILAYKLASSEIKVKIVLCCPLTKLSGRALHERGVYIAQTWILGEL